MQICVANFKMNKTQEEIKEYFSSFLGFKPKCKVKFAVPFTSIAMAAKKSPKWAEIGAQNVHFKSGGAYTGEISTKMLKEAGATFTLVGHSERRQFAGETDETACLRAKAAQEAGLEVVFCIGETLADRNAGNTRKVLKRQLLKGLGGLDPNGLIVAYEPVWAIGSGRTASADEIKDAHLFIKKTLNDIFNTDIPVIYGGSVNQENVNEICKINGVDGVLVGGISLNPEQMKELVLYGTKK